LTRFQMPTKLVKSPTAMSFFESSQAAMRLVKFVQSLGASVRGAKLSDECPASPLLERLLCTLSAVEGWAKEYPPVQQQFRYGNKAFRCWHSRLCVSSHKLVKELLPISHHEVIVELVPYLCESFGNPTRMDYGTGHETMFVFFLLCLEEIGLVTVEDHRALVCRVFAKYVSVVRTLQTVYWLEPAGSKGVWGLDDYCFLPFYWGSSQLFENEKISPDDINDPIILREACADYMYLDCIVFIKKVKKGQLRETSPLLNDISSVPTWKKVNAGLLRMYKVCQSDTC